MSFMKKLGSYATGLSLAVVSGSVMAADSIDATALTSGIDSAKPIIIAVGTSIFGLVGILVAIRYAKRAAS